MSARLRELKTWFPTGTAEGERQILERAFVYVSEFESIISPPDGSPILLVGRKGTGKSALVDFAQKILRNDDVPAILLKPEDFDTAPLGDAASSGESIRSFRSVVLKSIISKLAQDMPNFITGDRAVIYNEAIRSGELSPDLIGRIARILPTIAKPIVNADLSSVLPAISSSTRDEIEKAVERILKGKRFYVFIDDTDQVANPEKSGHLNRIWGLILSLRALCSEIPEIKCVITLRTEVWERLKRDNAAQRDQTDHFTNLVVEMSSSNEEIGRIVDRRLELAAQACELSGEMYECFFEGPKARAPHSDEYRLWKNLIVTRSRGRPRDAVQLVSAMATEASKNGNSRIKESDFQKIMPVFSERRAELFSQEVSQEFSPALDVVRSFSGIDYQAGSFTMNAEQVLKHLTSTLGRHAITLFGKTLHQNSQPDIFDLWRFLYNANVLNARVSDSSMPKGFRHLFPEQDPMLVTKSRWNELQAILWEINPAFRDYLIDRQKQQNLSTGLAVRRPIKKKLR
ncbi:AAA family ATPase [uncultured Brevundimonas sp.]|uniref:P-loop ATPase, Sll1717 family n=1 Tax=uncultured Brevundimonas sp. TaxID=213418 RepID=UPI0025F2FB05|nr:AAA family ATPase [uncultured Brevundimonas sp.]